ncbi:MAG: hypothetical protein ACOZAO_00155 [Patescibacteria group bacterium]
MSSKVSMTNGTLVEEKGEKKEEKKKKLPTCAKGCTKCPLVIALNTKS